MVSPNDRYQDYSFQTRAGKFLHMCQSNVSVRDVLELSVGEQRV